MSKILSVFLIGLLTYASALNVAQSACQYIVSDGSIYSFLGFKERNVTYTTEDSSDGYITFDLCSPDIKGCAADVQATAIAYPKNGTNAECENLASINGPVATYINSNDPQDGVILTFSAYTNSSVSNMLVVQVGCNDDISMDNMVWDISISNSDGHQVYTLKSEGDAGCPIFTIQSYLKFFEAYKILFATVFLLIGLFALLAGFRFFNVTIFIFTAIIVSVGLFILILTFTGLEISTGAQWGIFVGCLILGLGCGYGAVKLEKAGFFALGALFGGLGALFLYGLLLHFFDMGVVALYIVIVVCALAGGSLALWLWKDLIIVATSCVGSYLIIRGLSFYIGGFPNEIAVVQGVESYDYVDYIYLTFMIVLAIGGIIFQYNKKKKDEENEKEINTPESELSESISRY